MWQNRKVETKEVWLNAQLLALVLTVSQWAASSVGSPDCLHECFFFFSKWWKRFAVQIVGAWTYTWMCAVGWPTAMVSLFARVPPRLISPVPRFRLYSPLPPSNQSHHHYDYHHHFNDEYDPRKMEKEDVSSTLAVLLGASSPMRFLHPIPHVLIRRELNAFCHAHFLTRIFSISRSSWYCTMHD